MARRLSERTQAMIFLVVLATAIAGLYGWAQATQPTPVPPKQVQDVSLLVDGGTWTIHYGPITTTNNTVFLLLMEASHRLGFVVLWGHSQLPPGVFVTSINGSVNAQNGPGWQYWVGTTYGDRAADFFPLSSGDNVTWRYALGQGGG